MAKLNETKPVADDENEKIKFSFNKKSYSDLTKEFLCAKLDPEEDAEIISNLRNLMENVQKSLKVKTANALLKKILQAIIINDEIEEDEKFGADTDTDADDESENDDPPTQKEIKGATDPGLNSKTGKTPVKKTAPAKADIQSTSAAAIIEDKKAEDKKAQDKQKYNKELCRFFKETYLAPELAKPSYQLMLQGESIQTSLLSIPIDKYKNSLAIIIF